MQTFTKPQMIKTNDGQVFYGFLLSEGESIVLKDLIGKKIAIAPEKID